MGNESSAQLNAKVLTSLDSPERAYLYDLPRDIKQEALRANAFNAQNIAETNLAHTEERIQEATKALEKRTPPLQKILDKVMGRDGEWEAQLIHLRHILEKQRAAAQKRDEETRFALENIGFISPQEQADILLERIKEARRIQKIAIGLNMRKWLIAKGIEPNAWGSDFIHDSIGGRNLEETSGRQHQISAYLEDFEAKGGTRQITSEEYTRAEEIYRKWINELGKDMPDSEEEKYGLRPSSMGLHNRLNGLSSDQSLVAEGVTGGLVYSEEI